MRDGVVAGKGWTIMSDATERWTRNLRDELDGSALYAALAAAETDPARRDVFAEPSQAEAEHAQLWRKKLSAAGIDGGAFAPRRGASPGTS
jgi:hypothetical protein